MKELFLYEIVMKALLKSRGKWLSVKELVVKTKVNDGTVRAALRALYGVKAVSRNLVGTGKKAHFVFQVGNHVHSLGELQYAWRRAGDKERARKLAKSRALDKGTSPHTKTPPAPREKQPMVPISFFDEQVQEMIALKEEVADLRMRLENLEAYTPEDEVEMIKQFILEAKGPICSDIQERDDGIWVAILSGDELKVIQGG